MHHRCRPEASVADDGGANRGWSVPAPPTLRSGPGSGQGSGQGSGTGSGTGSGPRSGTGSARTRTAGARQITRQDPHRPGRHDAPPAGNRFCRTGPRPLISVKAFDQIRVKPSRKTHIRPCVNLAQIAQPTNFSKLTRLGCCIRTSSEYRDKQGGGATRPSTRRPIGQAGHAGRQTTTTLKKMTTKQCPTGGEYLWNVVNS